MTPSDIANMTPEERFSAALLVGEYATRPRGCGLDGLAYSFDAGKSWWDSADHAARVFP